MAYSKKATTRLSSYLEQTDQALRLELRHNGWSCCMDNDPSGTTRLLTPQPASSLAEALQSVAVTITDTYFKGKGKVEANSEWLGMVKPDQDRSLMQAMTRMVSVAPVEQRMHQVLVLERERGGSWKTWEGNQLHLPANLEDMPSYSDHHRDLGEAWVAAEKHMQELGWLKTKHMLPELGD